MAAPGLALRATSACLFVPLVLGLSWSGGWLLFALVIVVVGRGSWEFFHLAAAAGHRPAAKAGMLMCLCWPLCLQLDPSGQWLLPLTVSGAALALIATLRANAECYLTNAAVTVVGVVYVGILGSAPLQIVAFVVERQWPEPTAILVILFASIWITDTAAYLCGSYFGNRKLVPGISPGKTVVGFVAGTIGSVAPLVLHELVPLSLMELGGLLLLVGIFGQVGDIVESAIKRDAGVKDAPVLIPGHGGILDRFDSYLFAFPLCYVYLNIVGAN